MARAAMLLSMVMDPPTKDLLRGSKELRVTDAETGGAGMVLWKAVGGLAIAAGLAAFLAAIVAMCMMTPRSPREWAVGLISTVMSSLGGGAYVVLKMGLLDALPTDPARLYMALIAIAGVIFACGLPGWAIVRWTFTFIERRNDKDLLQIAGELREAALLGKQTHHTTGGTP
jgi:hypothetical protein